MILDLKPLNLAEVKELVKDLENYLKMMLEN